MLSTLIRFINSHDGINDKTKLAALVCKQFSCVKDRSVYYTQDFALRFCKARSTAFSNTVLSLSALQKYDNIPFVVCICAPQKNYLLLANTTFLSKVSHSSKELTMHNIRGSFNGTDIVREIDGIANTPGNFEILFAMHENISFEENLERLVEKTNGIVPTGRKFDITVGDRRKNITDSPQRAVAFAESREYADLRNDLDKRTMRFKNEILVAACIENVNLRGRIIEYIIAGNDHEMRAQLIESLTNKSELPRLITRDGIGDYTKRYPDYQTETDIKTKIMVLASAPKGYNIDKILKFLSLNNTVFMIYLVGIDYEKRTIKTKLISMFQKSLVENTIVQAHWAGRNSRGVSQFNGNAIKNIILNEENVIDHRKAANFLEKVLAL